MNVQLENFGLMAADASILIAKHWLEFYGNVSFRTDYGGMIDFEKTGNFFYFTLRTDENVLAGHTGFQVFKSPFYGNFIAQDIFYYILPEHRGGFGICRLLRFAGQTLKNKGVDVIVLSHKKEQNLSAIIKRSNFEHSGEVYFYKE